MKIVAVMPIKMNNERCPGKNTRMLGNKPLIQYQLEAMKAAGIADEIYVYCSTDEIEPYLTDGVIFLKRSAELDLPTSNFTQIFNAFVACVEADIYIYFHATAPFVKPQTIRHCTEAVLSGAYDSAFCAEKIQDYLWQDGAALNFDPENVPRSQDLKPIYRETSGIYVIPKATWMTCSRRIGRRPYIAEVDFAEAVDINTEEDFKKAQALKGMANNG